MRLRPFIIVFNCRCATLMDLHSLRLCLGKGCTTSNARHVLSRNVILANALIINRLEQSPHDRNPFAECVRMRFVLNAIWMATMLYDLYVVYICIGVVEHMENCVQLDCHMFVGGSYGFCDDMFTVFEYFFTSRKYNAYNRNGWNKPHTRVTIRKKCDRRHRMVIPNGHDTHIMFTTRGHDISHWECAMNLWSHPPDIGTHLIRFACVFLAYNYV